MDENPKYPRKNANNVKNKLGKQTSHYMKEIIATEHCYIIIKMVPKAGLEPARA